MSPAVLTRWPWYGRLFGGKQGARSLHLLGLLAPHADLILERSKRLGEPPWPAPLEGVRTKKYGDTLLCYGRAP